jgi:antitoxin component HigA of HigAB toxin-antitoxin module
MELKLLRNEAAYHAALNEAERLWDAPEADRLELLALLIEDYEARHYPIDDPDPIDFLRHAMEARGLESKDLEPYLGERADEVLIRRIPCGTRLEASYGLPVPGVSTSRRDRPGRSETAPRVRNPGPRPRRHGVPWGAAGCTTRRR